MPSADAAIAEQSAICEDSPFHCLRVRSLPLWILAAIALSVLLGYWQDWLEEPLFESLFMFWISVSVLLWGAWRLRRCGVSWGHLLRARSVGPYWRMAAGMTIAVLLFSFGWAWLGA